MKNHTIYIEILSVVLGFLLLGGCSNIFEGPPVEPPGEDPAGDLISIRIGYSPRTLLPSVPVFSKYELSFTAQDGQSEPDPVEISGTETGYTLSLEWGSWTVEVKGYVSIVNTPGIDAGEYEAASGSAGFSVDEYSGSQTVTVDLGGGMMGAKGIFAYDISFPEDVTAASLAIQNLAGQDHTVIDLAPPENRSGGIALEPGYYFVKAALENADGNWAYKTEILHIYSGLTTETGSGYAFSAAAFLPMRDISSPLLLSPEVSVETVTVSLYGDSSYTQPITSLALEDDGETWNAKIASYYETVYLKAEVDYYGFEPFISEKGPVAVSSTDAADWEIDARLLELSGTVLLETENSVDDTPTLSIYADSEYTELIVTEIISNSFDYLGTWSAYLVPGAYTSVYLKAEVDYDVYPSFTRVKGPVDVSFEDPDDWTIDMKLFRLTGTVPLFWTSDVTVPNLEVKVYSDENHTMPIQYEGNYLFSPLGGGEDPHIRTFEMPIPDSVLAAYQSQSLYFKVDPDEAYTGDYTFTGGTGVLTGASPPGNASLDLTPFYISGYCAVISPPINDVYGDQTGYGSVSVTAYDYSSGTAYKGSVTVTAAPNPGYVFMKWVAENDRTAPALSTNASYTFPILYDTTLYAVYNGDGSSASTSVEIWDAGTLSGGAYLTDATDAAASGTLNGMRNGLDKHYKLLRDITLTGTWTSTDAFSGGLDGNGKTLTFDPGSSIIPAAGAAAYVGIFGSVSSGAVVKNMTVAGTVSLSSGGTIRSGGAIAGVNDGTIEQCAVTASVTSSAPDYDCLTNTMLGEYGYPTGTGGIGGIAGSGGGIITASYVTGAVRAIGVDSELGQVLVGGIAGYVASSGTVSHCYTTGNVTSGESFNGAFRVGAGGIVGINGGIVEYCYALGTVQSVASGSTFWFAGGIAGVNDGVVDGGQLHNCAALNSNVISGLGSTMYPDHRVAGNNGDTLSNNYGIDSLSSTTNNPANADGATVSLSDTQSSSWWFGSGGIFYPFQGNTNAHPWQWDSTKSRPVLFWE